MPDVKRRVAIFAALANPIRLRIVDLLTLGDLSSSEIELLLKLRSNLVAHHLRVLEKADIVSRSRSEFDRRRSYIGLHPEVFGTLAPSDVPAPDRVVFVCTGNAARSLLAEAIWPKHSRIPAVAATTNPKPATAPPEVMDAAARHSLTLTGPVTPVSVVLNNRVQDSRDLVITVCDNAHEQMLGREDLHWSIPDPGASGSPEEFDNTITLTSRRIHALALRLNTRTETR